MECSLADCGICLELVASATLKSWFDLSQQPFPKATMETSWVVMSGFHIDGSEALKPLSGS